jgi:transcriptional regulatory protein LevR
MRVNVEIFIITNCVIGQLKIVNNALELDMLENCYTWEGIANSIKKVVEKGYVKFDKIVIVDIDANKMYLTDVEKIKDGKI